MKYVVDSYSWADYFDGNAAGIKIKQIIEDESNEIITNAVNIAEITNFLKRKGFTDQQAASTIAVIASIAQIHSPNTDFSIKTGLLYHEMRKTQKDFGLIDAFVLQTAKELGAKIITGDEHFRKVKEAIMIK